MLAEILEALLVLALGVGGFFVIGFALGVSFKDLATGLLPRLPQLP